MQTKGSGSINPEIRLRRENINYGWFGGRLSFQLVAQTQSLRWTLDHPWSSLVN